MGCEFIKRGPRRQTCNHRPGFDYTSEGAEASYGRSISFNETSFHEPNWLIMSDGSIETRHLFPTLCPGDQIGSPGAAKSGHAGYAAIRGGPESITYGSRGESEGI